MVIRAGPLRRVPRLLDVPRAQGDPADRLPAGPRSVPTASRRPSCRASARPAPKCGPTDGGTLVARRGRFGPFVGCVRYPDCNYIKKDGPPPPDPLPFEVVCPNCGQGHLTARRARRTGLGLLGLLALPKMRLHHLARAGRGDPRRRRRTGRPQAAEAAPPDAGSADGDAGRSARPEPGVCLRCGAADPAAGR